MIKNILIFTIGILIGLFITNYSHIDFIQPANAEVAGMDSYDLKYDYDFKKAVKEIVSSDCHISGDDIYCY